MINKKLKIIHVAQHLGVGGLEKIIFHLLIEQKRLGHDVSLYVYDYKRDWVEYFRQNDLKVITPPLKKEGYDFALLKNMNRDLFDADIIHSHDLNPIMYLSILFFIKKLFFIKTPKLIHTTHGLGYLDRFPRYKYYEKFASYFIDKIVGVSEKVKNFYTHKIKVNPKKVEFIPNGVSIYPLPITSQLRKEKKKKLCEIYQLDENLPIILSLSRILPLKNQKFLMNALIKRPGYQLLVAGPDSDADYYKELKKLTNAHIQLIGSQELVTDFNLGSDLYVSASTHEGLPVAVLEAISVETPCLVSDIPGHIFLNKEMELSTIFRNNDEQDFLQKFDQFFSKKDNITQDELQKTKRHFVEDVYSSRAMTEKYLKLYEEVMDKK